MKYIVFEDRNGRKFPVIFSNLLVHSDVAGGVMKACQGLYAIASAGETTIVALDTGGRSDTLDVEGDPQDATVINVHGYTAGVPGLLDNRTEALVKLQAITALMEDLKAQV